jgi:hypothetical protein
MDEFFDVGVFAAYYIGATVSSHAAARGNGFPVVAVGSMKIAIFPINGEYGEGFGLFGPACDHRC